MRKTELITALTPGAPLMTVVVGAVKKYDTFNCIELTKAQLLVVFRNNVLHKKCGIITAVLNRGRNL